MLQYITYKCWYGDRMYVHISWTKVMYKIMSSNWRDDPPVGVGRPICQGTVQCPPWAGWGASSIACPTSLDGKSIKVMGKTAGWVDDCYTSTGVSPSPNCVRRIFIQNGARVMLKCWSGTSWFFQRCTLCNCNSGPIWPESPGHHTLCADLYLPFRWFTPRTSRRSRASQVRLWLAMFTRWILYHLTPPSSKKKPLW